MSWFKDHWKSLLSGVCTVAVVVVAPIDKDLSAAIGTICTAILSRTEAKALADREGVDIRTYRVIYQLKDDIEQALIGMLSAVQTEEILGEVEVRALFKVSRLGTIAGCYVTSGVVKRGSKVRVFREGAVIQDSSIDQLKRFKEDAREVQTGFECGILLSNFNDLREGDVLEVYEVREVERTSLDEPATASQ